MVAQSIFIRELMPLFTGTEFVIGALLSFWLLWVGVGALLGGRIRRRPSSPRAFSALAVFLAISLVGTVVAIRLGRGALARPPGSLPSPGGALLFSFLVTAPFGFAYGAMYDVASILWSGRSGGLQGGIARVYLWESAGSVFGAALFSFALVEAFSQLQAALVAAGLLVLLTALDASARRPVSLRRAGAALAFVFALGALSPRIDRGSVTAMYPGYRVEEHFTSRYGEIVMTEREGLRSVFSGGGRICSYPEPEKIEEMIHIPLLLCAEPRSVLLIGSSLGGGLTETLKHASVERVDCVELDGGLFRIGEAIGGPRYEAAGEYRVPGGAAGGGDRRVRLIAADGRFFVARSRERYDCVILSSPPPVNLQWNRYYTREFFEAVRKTLRPGGVFGFTHPSSENALTMEQARPLRILERTLARAFPCVLVLPGSTAHFIASDSSIDPGVMASRYLDRGLDAPFVSDGYLPFRLAPERIADGRDDLDRAGDPPFNSDARPSLPLHELLLEGRRSGSLFTAGFGAILRVPPFLVAAAFGLLFLVLFGAARFGPRGGPGARAALAVWSVGLGSFLLQVLVLLSYQAYEGILYTGVVLLTALFMAGAAAGSFAAIRHAGWERKALRRMHVGFALLAAVPAIWAAVLRSWGLEAGYGSLPYFAVAGCAGFLTGSYYAVVVRTAFTDGGKRIPALFYAWDLFGACAGGWLGGMLLFPSVGLAGAALCISLMHALALALVAGRW